jgi:hypothetical protein
LTDDILIVAGIIFLIVIPGAWLLMTLAAIVIDLRKAGRIQSGRDGEEARREFARETGADPVRFALRGVTRATTAPWRVILGALIPPERAAMKEGEQEVKTQAAAPCLVCGTPDPAPEMTCGGGGYEFDPRDHFVGDGAGCPNCGRLKAACARRPCSVMRRNRLAIWAWSLRRRFRAPG